jgi:large subunit ribosomal protein L21
MYAVIKTGGKQYRVVAGERLKVEKLEVEVGGKVALDQVLVLSDGETTTIGAPIIKGAVVNATVVSHGRGDKVMIFKFRRRKHYRKTQGHRQSYTEIMISDIGGKSAAAKPAAAKTTAKAKKDDLTIVEGIGPKIADLLIADGIVTFADLASAKVEAIAAILEKAGSRFSTHKPDTWPQQAALARDGKMDELKALQDALDGGKVK